MTTVPQITRRRSYKRNREHHKPSGGVALGCSLLASLLLLLGGVFLSFFYVILTRDLPSLEVFPLYLDQPNGMLHQPTELFDRTGEHVLLRLKNPAAEEARYLVVDRAANNGSKFFSAELVQTTISSLEPAYWDDDEAILGGLFNERENTIAQQLISEITLWDEPEGIWRDLRVRLLASQLLGEFGKEKILEWYLNSAKYGDLIYGADAAALAYLGKSASKLNLAEAALITSIAGAPDINPHTVPELAGDRQKDLIQNMLDQGVISSEEARSAFRQIFNFREAMDLQDDYQPFTDYVLDQLASIMPSDRLEHGGLKVITSLDYDLQVQAQCAIEAYLAQPGVQATDIPAIDGSACEVARLLPTLLISGGEFPERLNGTVAITDPSEGQLLAYVALSAGDEAQAQDSRIPVGTALTPFIYLTAFTRGFNPGTMVWDIPEDLESSENESSDIALDKLVNDPEPHHGPMRLRTALANDYLRPTLSLMGQIGFENVITTLSRFELFSGNSLDAQTDTVRLLFEEELGLIEVVRAYGILANQGVIAGQVVVQGRDANDQQRVDLSGVLRIDDFFGNAQLDWTTPQSRSIVSSQLAYLVSHILSDETARWESLGHPNPLEIGRTAAVKLSRTIDGRGTWVVGYDPERVVGVWIGSRDDDRVSQLHELSSGLWHAIIQYALRDIPADPWQVPPGISSVEVCEPSGLLPTPNCPTVVTETFLSGQEPTHFDTLYRSFQVNRETGNLATVFTPPELIEERVYLVVPPQALEWARSADLQLPPANYDAVGVQSNVTPNVRIDSPEMFSHIKGEVAIRGSAGGAGFSYYRIQVGQGLNPQEWIQIGKNFTEPVKDDILVTWETEGLSGLYAIQLMVVREDQRVGTVVRQVTIDNELPQVKILLPEDGVDVSASETGDLVIRAEAVDDLEVARLDFFLDDQLLATLTIPPYVITWEPRIGNHTLVVEAHDMAGNMSRDAIEFTVRK